MADNVQQCIAREGFSRRCGLQPPLRDLEENGFVIRTVMPVVPPQVEYALTDPGRDFLTPVQGLANWVVANSAQIDAARAAYAIKKDSE